MPKDEGNPYSEAPNERHSGRRWRVLSIVLTGAVVAGAVVLVWPGEREPEYQGKKLSEWLETGASDQAGTQEEQAARIAVQQIGTNALPYLVETIAYEPSALEVKLIQAVRVRQAQPTRIRTFILRKLIAADRHARFAGYGFLVLGTSASPAVPDLARQMNSTNGYASMRAMQALAVIGEAGLPPLLVVLADKRHANRATAARSVYNLYLTTRTRTNASVALPVLIGGLKDNDNDVVMEAAALLGFLKMESWVCVPALTELTQHTNPLVRGRVAHVLGQFGKDAQSALPVLLDSFKDPDAGVREVAAEAVQIITQDILGKKGGP
jgi:hypothetical protein